MFRQGHRHGGYRIRPGPCCPTFASLEVLVSIIVIQRDFCGIGGNKEPANIYKHAGTYMDFHFHCLPRPNLQCRLCSTGQTSWSWLGLYSSPCSLLVSLMQPRDIGSLRDPLAYRCWETCTKSRCMTSRKRLLNGSRSMVRAFTFIRYARSI